nr:SMP-30/gluconolactonase/LRE family protein [Enterobacter hormaechei]
MGCAQGAFIFCRYFRWEDPRSDPASTSGGHLSITTRTGALAQIDKGNLIFAENASVAMLDVDSGEVYMHSNDVHDGVSYRFNNGACDPQGRFVTGLMDEGPSRKTGVLYRYDSELNTQVILRDMAPPNGLV